MTATDFGEADPASWIAVVPVCAIEQHGPHLPLGTDTFIAEGLVRRSIERLPDDLGVTFLPLQAVGKSNEHISSPGTLTLSWQTAVEAWIGLGESVRRAGVEKIVFITAHGGNVPVIDIVARELRVRHDVLAVTTAWSRFGYPPGLFDPDEVALGIHGGEIETAMMLYLRPDLVRIERARDFPSAQRAFLAEFKHLRAHGPAQFAWKAQDLNPDGVVGNAAAATPEKGFAAIDHQAAAFVALCTDIDGFDPGRLWTGSPAS